MKRFLVLFQMFSLSCVCCGVDWKYDTGGRAGIFPDAVVYTAVSAEIVAPWETALLGVLSAETETDVFDTRRAGEVSVTGFALSFMETPMCLIFR